MDADNRVVINCGGIRHEVYKVEISLVQNIFLVFLSINCKMFKFLCPSVNESSYNCNHLSVSLTTQSVFSCENAALQVLMSVCLSVCNQVEILIHFKLITLNKVQGRIREGSGKVPEGS